MKKSKHSHVTKVKTLFVCAGDVIFDHLLQQAFNQVNLCHFYLIYLVC